SFLAFSEGFKGGVFVAAGDVNHDGFNDIITGAGAGGSPRVKVFDRHNAAIPFNFLAYSSSFSGGVRVASGDVNHDGRADIITGARGPLSSPEVRTFDGLTLAELDTFFAFGTAFRGGVFVDGF